MSRRVATVTSQPFGVVRQAGGRPLRRRRQEGLLDRVLAGAEVAVSSDERGEDLRRQLAQEAPPP